MKLIDAITLFMKKNPGRVVTGYWEQDDGYILNTKSLGALKKLTAPGQFVVTDNGEIYGTNPINSNLDVSKMKKP